VSIAENLARIASFLTADTSGNLTGTTTPPSNDNSKALATTEWFNLLAAAHGQCRLAYVSGTSIKLSPANGRSLIINGTAQQVPTAGVTVSNSGLAASTLYYVYAYMNAGAMALELSTTGHSTNTNCVEIKSGDASRTLVGMAYLNASSQFQDDTANLLVLSYFNRKRKVGKAKFTADRFMASSVGVFSEVNTEIRVTFLTWADEPVRQAICGGWTVNGAATGYGYANIDNDTSGQRAWCSTSSNTTTTLSSVDERFVTEGYHFGSLTGNCASGTSVQYIGGKNGEVSHVLTVAG
jgi:hypothetical protein